MLRTLLSSVGGPKLKVASFQEPRPCVTTLSARELAVQMSSSPSVSTSRTARNGFGAIGGAMDDQDSDSLLPSGRSRAIQFPHDGSMTAISSSPPPSRSPAANATGKQASASVGGRIVSASPVSDSIISNA